MSIESNGYLGKDGKRYNSMWELDNANKVVEEQEKQTKLLEMQANFEVLKAQQELVKMQQEKELEYKRQEHEKQLELERQEHEKEMRLLQMFDNVSIPIDIYNKFENNLFDKSVDTDIMSEEDAIKYGNLLVTSVDNISSIKENREKLINTINNNDEQAVIHNQVNYTEPYQKYENFINGKISIKDISKEDLKNLNLDKYITDLSKCKNLIDAYVGLSIFMLMGIAMLFMEQIGFGMLVICGICILIAVIENNKKTVILDMKNNINKSINVKMLETFDKEHMGEVEKVQNNEELKLLQEKYQYAIEESLKKKLKYLYDFRINHYNMQIEKLFFDSGLIKRCEENNVKFMNIDKTSIIAEGTYEDYFLFFNNFEQGYNEYEKENIVSNIHDRKEIVSTET